MKTLIVVPFLMFAANAFAVTPDASQAGPKNLASPVYHAAAVQAPHELTKRDITKLTRTAETAADHEKIAKFYRAEGNRLDALAAAYDKAAESYRTGPKIKNLSAPAAPGRYQFAARELYEDAAAQQALADAHEEMASGGFHARTGSCCSLRHGACSMQRNKPMN